jgi:hypothetical protein
MRGFIIACPLKYQHFCLQNALKIRNTYNIDLPIEIWQIGQEISSDFMVQFEKIPNLSFQNVATYTETPNHWRGFQVKAFILKHTSLTEPILCDADIVFHCNPLILYEDEGYLATGTYFFRDLEQWKFHDLREPSPEKFQSLAFFNMRKNFIKWVAGEKKSQYFPAEWGYVYEDSVPTIPVAEAYQESGVVVMNKTKNNDIVERIYFLNDYHQYTYQFVHGDKETFWLGCIMAGKPYTINPTYGFMQDNKLTHKYKNTIIFTQK